MPTVNQQVASQLARKIKLEKQFAPKLRRFFNGLYLDASIVYEATQGILQVNAYREELTGLLKEHYRNVMNGFINDYKSFLDFETKQADIEDDESNAVYIIASLLMLNYIKQHAPSQSGYILQTTQGDISSSIAKTMQKIADAGGQITPSTVANGMRKELTSGLSSKIETIAITETQNVAEKTKLTSAEVNAGELTIAGQKPIKKKEATKTWHSVLDGNERPAHGRADGQTVGIKEAFIVDGESLMVPGDLSLGASLGNALRCRCDATYDFE